jgi:hypothetical protein
MEFYKQRSTWWSGNCYHKEQLDAILGSPDVRAYAYILHDKCKNEKGENLKPHFHFLLQFTQTQRGSWFKAFTSEDMGIVFIEPTRSPIDAFNYLIHDTEKCKKEGKHLYDQSERISTIEDFKAEEREDEHIGLFNDIIELLDDKILWFDLLQRKPKRIHMIANIKVAYDLLKTERYTQRSNNVRNKQDTLG